MEILVDEGGYKQFIDQLEELKKESISSAFEGKEAYDIAVGDGWHDNFGFEAAMEKSRMLSNKIDALYEEKKMLKIVSNEGLKDNQVKIGDLVKLEFKDTDEIEVLRLTGNYITTTDDISLNSPLGRELFKAKIGSTIKYIVNDITHEVKIISKEWFFYFEWKKYIRCSIIVSIR